MQYILRSEDQDTLQKDDFTLMQSYITDLIAYKEVLMQKFPNQNISLFSIEKSYKSRILEDNRVKNALDRIQGRSLDYMIQLCKTPEEFERMCGNNDVRDVLKDSKETNIGLIIHLYKIQTSEEFERMCGKIHENMGIRNFLNYSEKNFECLIRLCKTPEEFERMCGNNDVRDVLKDSKETNIGLIIHLYKIQTSEEFERMCGSKNLGMFLICSQKNNPDYMIQLCKTPEEFERMCKNKGV